MLSDCRAPWLPFWGSGRAALPDGPDDLWDQQYNPNDPYVRVLVAQIDQYTRHCAAARWRSATGMCSGTRETPSGRATRTTTARSPG